MSLNNFIILQNKGCPAIVGQPFSAFITDDALEMLLQCYDDALMTI
ncbi:MAG: hypothetical protein RR349_03205 [Oscillospiraceae bacterium]